MSKGATSEACLLTIQRIGLTVLMIQRMGLTNRMTGRVAAERSIHAANYGAQVENAPFLSTGQQELAQSNPRYHCSSNSNSAAATATVAWHSLCLRCVASSMPVLRIQHRHLRSAGADNKRDQNYLQTTLASALASAIDNWN